MSYSVVLDTCVLYPAYLRDTLLRLAEATLFRPLWSEDILEELGRNLTEAGIPAEVVRRLLTEMQAAFEGADVVGYQSFLPDMTCDPKDRHVLAAAVSSRADALVTFNVKDFPAASRAPYDIELLSPDGFLLGLLDAEPRLVMHTLAEQAACYKREPRSIWGLLTALERAGVPGFAEEIRRQFG
ncbi:PIN domain-containing protein [Nonomuraea sp. B19D2]|uniref:PIN domain-containing protein n=1 Tax=Nonomuraea sp. B19D2 TaxID=3159561 RepID=UPI0032DAA781